MCKSVCKVIWRWLSRYETSIVTKKDAFPLVGACLVVTVSVGWMTRVVGKYYEISEWP